MPRIPGTPFPGGHRPIIPVTIEANGRTLPFDALIDSGADRTVVPGEFMAQFGISFASLGFSDPNPSSGVGAAGGGHTRYCDGTIRWGTTILASSFQVAPPSTRPPAVCLGRNDFFRNYVVRFSWHKDPPVFDLDPIVKVR
jgi:hypothetical protein